MTVNTEPRRAADREIGLAKAWVRANNEVQPDGWDPTDEDEYTKALEIIIFANGGRYLRPPYVGGLVKHDPRAVAALDAAIGPGRMQGDPIPEPEHLLDELAKHGYSVVRTNQVIGRRPVDDPEHPLHGDQYADDPDNLLVQFAEWLDRKGQLAEIPDDVATDLEDLVNHFMSDRREARARAGDD